MQTHEIWAHNAEQMAKAAQYEASGEPWQWCTGEGGRWHSGEGDCPGWTVVGDCCYYIRSLREARNAEQKALYDRLKAEGKAIQWKLGETQEGMEEEEWKPLTKGLSWTLDSWYAVREKPEPELTARKRLVRLLEREVTGTVTCAENMASAIIAAVREELEAQ